MAQRQLYIRADEGEVTMEDAQRRENREAPHGRCGDTITSRYDFPGCGNPLSSNDDYVCGIYPDCCRE